MMGLMDLATINLLRKFSPSDVAEFLQHHLADHSKTGRIYCSFYTGTEVRDDHLEFVGAPSVMFGRDIFGKISLCYRITGKTFECRRFPGEINSGWRDVPQGTVVIIRGREMARNNIIFQEPDFRVCLEFNFKDIWNCDAYIFTFKINEAVTVFLERLRGAISNVTVIPLNRGEGLLHPNTTLLSTEALEAVKTTYVNDFIDLFKEALSLRYLSPHSETLLFLFSGGVDSLFVTLMASIVAHEDSQFILVNVSFSEDGKDFEAAPDRKRGLDAFEFLKSKFPTRSFHFLRVDVTKEELQRERTSSIAKAVAPGTTVLDDSIGCVVWFASRAHGTIDGVTKKFDDVEKVFVGSGSDEILGGYSRHRGRFEREGYEGLFEELQHEIQNIGNRNLGRDDRVAVSNNRTMLAPFLDESIVRYINRVPIQLKVDFSKPRGIGEKIILREALKQFDVPEALYTAPKKAMQFGTRIAKLENRAEKGSDQCLRLVA